MTELDRAWLKRNLLPPVEGETDKNARGRVLIAGGSRTVPGALLLTGEASLRSGAGKVQLASVEAAAMGLGLAMPEAAVHGLAANEEGELAADAAEELIALLDQADALVLGPGMGKHSAAAPVLRRVLASDASEIGVVVDAAAIPGARGCADAIRARRGAVVMTPHPGEMCALMGCDEAMLRDDPEGLARSAAERFGCVVVLKQAETWVAAPGEEMLHYAGGGPGLATAGSGDVLAGVLGGLLARGAGPRLASAWAVWLHGEAGRYLSERCRAPIGLLARELPAVIPSLMGELGKPDELGEQGRVTGEGDGWG